MIQDNDGGQGASATPTGLSSFGSSPQAVSPVPASIPSARVLIFDDDPERKPRLYACAKCGSVHSPEIYLATAERKHAAAIDAAENCYTCKTHGTCKDCGCETPKSWLRCDSCRYSAALERAAEVPDDGGPYCAFDGDEYFHDMEEARDAGLEWVSPCEITYPRIDIDTVFDSILSDMHEDASVDDLNGVADLEAAIKAFNDAQTTQSWFGDSKRKIRVPAQGMETAEAAETAGLSPKGDSPVPQGCAQGDLS